MKLFYFFVFLVNIFVIFSLLRNTRKDENDHLVKMETLQSTLEVMQQTNQNLKNRNQLAADFESNYKTFLTSFLAQIFDLHHLFLGRISQK